MRPVPPIAGNGPVPPIAGNGRRAEVRTGDPEPGFMPARVDIRLPAEPGPAAGRILPGAGASGVGQMIGVCAVRRHIHPAA
jgi:hypothetical protein